MAAAQKPLELILARNLMASLSTPAFLIDEEAALVFYNDAAAGLLGRRFEELGRLALGEWGPMFAPMAPGGRALDLEELPIIKALRNGKPVHESLAITALDGSTRWLEVSAMPLVAGGGARGAMAIFWAVDEE